VLRFRRPTIEIVAPLEPRTKVRLVRAVGNALMHPSNSLPRLRENVLLAATELRLSSFSNAQIHEVLAMLIEEVAHARSLDGASILSGQPRWMDLAARVNEWLDAEGPANNAF